MQLEEICWQVCIFGRKAEVALHSPSQVHRHVESGDPTHSELTNVLSIGRKNRRLHSLPQALSVIITATILYPRNRNKTSQTEQLIGRPVSLLVLLFSSVSVVSKQSRHRTYRPSCNKYPSEEVALEETEGLGWQ